MSANNLNEWKHLYVNEHIFGNLTDAEIIPAVQRNNNSMTQEYFLYF